MAHIQVLDQVTIDKIAAGEVIERPASVVKELVENAIDAGASFVTVEIEEGGISMIRIKDNGAGIVKEDIRNAFLRHSTSKIHCVEDLAHIASLGFRGEALSSIAAVAKVELVTKPKEETFGTRYVIEGGNEVSLEETGAADGTIFLVRQLFFNMPARRKFLKTAVTEAGHVQDLLMRLALSHPEVGIRFVNNGQEKLRSPGSGKLDEVIYQLYGRDVASNLMKLYFEQSGICISGYIGKPVIARGNRNFETFFVNGRYVKSAIISRALEDAYKDFSMQHKFPFAVLAFSVDGEQVDVNVHPTKMELRFQRQQDVYQAVFEGIHRTLLAPELIPKVPVPEPAGQNTKQADAEKQAESPFLLKPKKEAVEEGVRNEEYFIRKMKERVAAKHQRPDFGEQAASPEHPPVPTGEPVREEPGGGLESVQEPARKSDDRFWEPAKKEYKNGEVCLPFPEVIREAANYHAENTQAVKPLTRTEETVSARQLDLFEETFLKREIRAEYKLIGQVFETYWLVQFQDNLYIIDQHAAHERVLYERTLKEMKSREYTSQNLSPPIILSLSMQEAQLLEAYMERFEKIGFEIEHFGGKEYAVRAVPDNLFGIAKKDLLLEMLDSLTDGVNPAMTPDLIDERVASLSCKAAVKGNSRLSAKEVDALIGELLLLENPYHCPHGRPTIIAMSRRELEKKFKRIV